MAQTPLTSWGKWQQTRNTLAVTLALSIAGRNGATAGSTEKAQFQASLDQTLSDMQDHALNGLRAVDLAANPALVNQITAASAAAKREADRLRNTADNINKLTQLVGQITQLVGQFKLL